MLFLYSVIMHITLILPVKAHCCVSIYMDVEGPAVMSIYSLKSAFILVQLTKEEAEKAPSPSYRDAPSF